MIKTSSSFHFLPLIRSAYVNIMTYKTVRTTCKCVDILSRLYGLGYYDFLSCSHSDSHK